MTSDFVSVCCCIINLTTWQSVEKTVEKKGMVLKPSFKCLKNKKINFCLVLAILKLETLLYKNIYILIHLILYSQSDFDSKKKSGLREKKHAIYIISSYFIFVEPF